MAILYFIVTDIKCAEKAVNLTNADQTILDEVLTNIFKISNVSDDIVPILNNSTHGGVVQLEVELSGELLGEEERGKRCLKNVTKCLNEDLTFHPTKNRLLDFISTSMPPFDLSHVPGVSRRCQRDSRKYIQDLNKFKLWALKMYDSSAKMPSGILNGNVNQLGDFDMCLSVASDEQDVHGQYCLGSLEVQIPYSPYLAGLHKLIQSHYHFKSKLEDPGHRVPRFSSINWALCVPSSCTARDVEVGLKKTVRGILDGTEIEVRYEVSPAMCQSVKSKHVPKSTWIAVFLFGCIIFFEIFASFYGVFAVGEKNGFITSFSLTNNYKKLMTINKSANDIDTVHVIRMLNAVLLLLAHKSMAVFFTPYMNRTEFVEIMSKPFTVLGRAASLYTDPFIMISGLLTSYSLIGKLKKTGKIDIIQEYVSRLYRIIPTLAALIAFCTFILPWINNGPMWNMVITHHSDVCKKYWWRNLLFIHNYFGFQDMCLTHTHHLGIDTQLFFVSPFMIYGLWRWPFKGSMVLVFLATLATIARFYVTYSMRLSNYVHFGTSVEQLFRTADNMYILPSHRVTVYIMGIFMGYLLRNRGHIAFSKAQLRLGNTLAVFCFLGSYFGVTFMGSMDYVYNPIDAAWYAAISPIFWVASFCWLIYTSHLGYQGRITRMVTHPIWTCWSKISYTVYLTQFPIFFYNIGVTRSTHEYGFFTKMMNLQEYFWVLILSIALTLLIEMPFQNVRNLKMKRTEHKCSEVKKVS